MLGRDELCDAEEEESERKQAKHHQDCEVGLECRNEEDDGEEAPYDEENADSKAKGALVSVICGLDAQRRDEKHGKGKPESTV